MGITQLTPEQVFQNAKVGFRAAAGGAELVSTCPFCGKEDHFYVNASSGVFHCKKCSRAGGFAEMAESFGQEIRNGGPNNQHLTDRALAMNAALTPAVRAWLTSRGLGPMIGIRRYGFDVQKRRISIPYWKGDEVVSIRYRVMPGEESRVSMKYETEKHDIGRLYNSDSLNGAKFAIITEGEFDCDLLCSYSEALKDFAIVGCPGASSFKKEWAKLFQRFEKVYIIFDPDKSGREGADRVATLIGSRAIVVDLPESWGDLTDALTRRGRTIDELISWLYHSEEWRYVPAPLRRAIPETGFIKTFMDYSTPLTDAPIEFLLAGSIMALATAAGNNIWFRGWGGLTVYPNVWCVLTAPPGFFRKSTSLNLVKSLIRHTSISNRVLPESWSREALFDVLKGNPTGTFFYSEFTSLTSALHQEYMSGTKDDLTAFFEDPSPPERRTRAGGTIKLENVSLNIFGATVFDWFLDSIKSGDIRGGFLTRFIFVPATRKTRHIALPPDPDTVQQNLLVSHLQAIPGDPREIRLDKIKDHYLAWLTQHQNQNIDPDLQGFYSRLATYILKLAVLYELSFRPTSTEVTTEAWEYAQNLTNWLRDTVENLIKQEIAFTPFQQKRKKVLGVIKANPGVAHHTLAERVRMSSREIKEVLDSLIEERSIYFEVEKTRGRPLRRYLPIGDRQ